MRALVTGAAGGIGRAVCELLSRDGAEVIAVDRRFDEAEPSPYSIKHHCDISDDRERDALCACVGAVDWLVNAAGVIGIHRIAEVTPADWDTVFAVNARAMFFLTQSVVASMPDGAAIVNLGSTAGKTASTVEAAPYNASKAAVIAMTKTFAHAYAARAIRVNCVCPGNVTTPMLQQVYDGLARARATAPREIELQYRRSIPFGRAAAPEEVASVIAFLLSTRAGFMTGQSVNVSGGLVMY